MEAMALKLCYQWKKEDLKVILFYRMKEKIFLKYILSKKSTDGILWVGVILSLF